MRLTHCIKVKGKGLNYRDINLLTLVDEIYTGALVNRVRGMTEGLIDDKQGSARA